MVACLGCFCGQDICKFQDFEIRPQVCRLSGKTVSKQQRNCKQREARQEKRSEANLLQLSAKLGGSKVKVLFSSKCF